jgi:hypothetical protein
MEMRHLWEDNGFARRQGFRMGGIALSLRAG